MGQSRPLFVYFCYFHDTISIIQFEKSIDGVLGIRTRGRRMVGPDKTTELWRPPIIKLPLLCMFFLFAVSKKSIGRSVLQAMFITLITLKLMIKLTQTVLNCSEGKFSQPKWWFCYWRSSHGQQTTNYKH